MALCAHHFQIKDKRGRLYKVPCGHCASCKKERSKAWGVRMLLESEYYKETSFITLTYDDEHLPLKCCEDGIFNTLVKTDLQKFLKRLYGRLGKFRYYACGEYGSKTFRPHYHIIAFGISPLDKEIIQESWQYGFVDVNPVDIRAFNYVAGYVQKKLYGSSAEQEYKNITPPFSIMSKGIGKRYLLEHKYELLRDGYIQIRDKRVPIPRYFWKLMVKTGVLSEFDCKMYSDDRLEKMEKTRQILADRIGIPYTELYRYEDERFYNKLKKDEKSISMFDKGVL